MSYDIVVSKEYFIEFIKHIRKSMKYEDKKNIYRIKELFIDNRIDVYFNKEFWRKLSVFKFDDGFKIELSDDELTAVALILFYEIDLMNQNTKVEIKKEKNIWAFNPDLAEYLPNGNIMRSFTLLKHFKDECHKLLSAFGKVESYEGKNQEIEEILQKKSTRIEDTQSDLTVYFYKFDNGLEIDLSNYEIEDIVKMLTDESV